MTVFAAADYINVTLAQLRELMDFVVAKRELGSELGHGGWRRWIQLLYMQEKAFPEASERVEVSGDGKGSATVNQRVGGP